MLFAAIATIISSGTVTPLNARDPTALIMSPGGFSAPTPTLELSGGEAEAAADAAWTGGDASRALAFYLHALKSGNGSRALGFKTAITQLLSGEPRQAVRPALERLLEREPDYAPAHWALATVQEYPDDQACKDAASCSLALGSISKALALAPKAAALHFDSASLKRKLALLEGSDRRQAGLAAAPGCRKALALAPDWDRKLIACEDYFVDAGLAKDAARARKFLDRFLDTAPERDLDRHNLTSGKYYLRYLAIIEAARP